MRGWVALARWSSSAWPLSAVASEGLADDFGVGVGVRAQGGQVAAIGVGVVAGVLSGSRVVRVGG